MPLLVNPAHPAGALRSLTQPSLEVDDRLLARATHQWAFDILGLHRVCLHHSTANLASCRVAAELGFRVEGTLRGAIHHADGWHDVHTHARLRTDR